jgi:hypothetical protein
MKNVNMEEFSYDTFKMAYDSDPVIQALVHRFDDKGVELKTKNTKDNAEVGGKDRAGAVSQMAKRATQKARNRA